MMLLQLIKITCVKSVEVYLYNVGNSKFLSGRYNENYKPFFNKDPYTRYNLNSNKYTPISVIPIQKDGTNISNYSIKSPVSGSSKAEMKKVLSENDKDILSIKKIKKNTYRFKKKGKCLASSENNLKWKRCIEFKKNQQWKLLYPEKSNFMKELKKLLNSNKSEFEESSSAVEKCETEKNSTSDESTDSSSSVESDDKLDSDNETSSENTKRKRRRRSFYVISLDEKEHQKMPHGLLSRELKSPFIRTRY
ncbi:hypothetical protein CDIK_0847 [Cucumispora dikerogammari]|nr:hypothetical protein CDIK_0847 [Cucumispora dikerogammari]